MLKPGNSNKKSAIQITLDGQPIVLEGETTLAGVRAHLETLSLRDRRFLFSLVVDGHEINLAGMLDLRQQFEKVDGTSIGFADVGSHIVSLSAQQVLGLRERVERIALLVMINEWPTVQRIWWELLPEIKNPLVSLNYLPELISKFPEKLQTQHLEPFVALVQELRFILIELDDLCHRQDSLAFSEALEKDLARWLTTMAGLLETMYARKAA